MTERRKALVPVLVALVALLIGVGLLGALGSVETLIWLGLVAAWLVVFISWGRRRPHNGPI